MLVALSQRPGLSLTSPDRSPSPSPAPICPGTGTGRPSPICPEAGTLPESPVPVTVPDLSGIGDAPPSPIPIGGSAPWDS